MRNGNGREEQPEYAVAAEDGAAVQGSRARIFWDELCDLLTGAAFPFMLMCILSATIISYASYGSDTGIAVAALVLGEALMVAAFVLCGKQNGVTAQRKSIQQAKKRELGAADRKAAGKVGEYALWKAFAVALIACVPYLVIQLVQCAAPNAGCLFLLEYAFGWAYFPLWFTGASEWWNFIWVVPFVCLHAGAYVYGAYRERQRQKKVAEAEKMQGKKRRK